VFFDDYDDANKNIAYNVVAMQSNDTHEDVPRLVQSCADDDLLFFFLFLPFL